MPDPDPTGERGPDADVELAGDCVETTALGVVRIDGELFVGVAERFPGPDAQQQAKRLLACRNRHAERYGLTPYTHKDLDPWELDGQTRTTAVYGGCAQPTAACQDGRRLLGLVLDSPALRRVAG